MNVNILNIKNFVNRPLFLLFFISFLARAMYGFILNSHISVNSYVDDLDYISYANNVLTQGIWVPDITKLYSNSHLVAPGYPMVLAFLFYIFGQSYIVTILFNSLVASVSVILIFFITSEIFDKKIGFISSLVAGFYPLFYISIPRFLKEDLILLLLLVSVYLFIKETKSNRISHFILSFSVAFSVLIHVDERYFTYLLVFTVGFIFLRKDVNIITGIKRSSIFIILVSFLMIPWLIRNYVVYGERVVVITEQTSRFTDKIFGYDPMLSAYGKKQEKYSKFKWKDSYASNLLMDKDVPNLAKGKRYRSLQQGVKDGNIPHEFSITEGLANNFIEHWRPIRLNGGYIGSGLRYAKPWSKVHNITSGLSFGLLLPFFVIGSIVIFRRINKYGILLFSFVFVNTLLHVLLFAGKERYRIPIDAFVIIIACQFIYNIFLLEMNTKHTKKLDEFITKLTNDFSGNLR